jgi:hypothetical protein
MPVTINGTTGITTPAENTSALTVGSITGMLKASSGVVSQAVAGTDYLVGGGSAITATNTAKAWVNFNGATRTNGTAAPIRSSFNISSVTYNQAGDFTISFITPMVDANYSIVANASISDDNTAFCVVAIASAPPGNLVVPTTSSFRIATSSILALRNPTYVTVAVFGN